MKKNSCKWKPETNLMWNRCVVVKLWNRLNRNKEEFAMVKSWNRLNRNKEESCKHNPNRLNPKPKWKHRRKGTWDGETVRRRAWKPENYLNWSLEGILEEETSSWKTNRRLEKPIAVLEGVWIGFLWNKSAFAQK